MMRMSDYDLDFYVRNYGDTTVIGNLAREVTKLRQFVEFVKNAPVSSGVCCCGAEMPCTEHGTDQWDHALSKWVEELES